MRIATWSINGVRMRKELLLRWLDEQKPDVVALQKIRSSEEVFRRELRSILSEDRFSGSGSAEYCARVWCRENEYGVAILSRSKPEVVQEGLPGQRKLGPRFLTVEVNGLQVSSVYAPYGDDIRRRADWLEALSAHVRSRGSGSQKCLLCGDFNVSAERRGRTGNRKTEHEELRRKFTALCGLGFIDLYMPPPEGQGRFTYTGSQGEIKLTKLQYMLGTVSVAKCLRGAPTVEVEYRRPGAGNAWWAPLVAQLDD